MVIDGVAMDVPNTRSYAVKYKYSGGMEQVGRGGTMKKYLGKSRKLKSQLCRTLTTSVELLRYLFKYKYF